VKAHKALRFLLSTCLLGGALTVCSSEDPVDGSTIDADSDSWPADQDCDDNDPSAHPDGVEICDGRDNDCDDLIDEEATDAQRFYADADDDGFGDDGLSMLSCEQPDGYVAKSGDCDDEDKAVFPGAEEICNGIDDDCDDAIDEQIPSDGAGCLDPGLPSFPTTVDTVVVSIRTGDGANDGTDKNALSICLSASDCFPLDVPDVNDFRIGEMDVYHFEGVALPRADIDRVQIKSSNGVDRWVPACVEIQLDGEPVYCQPEMGQKFGNAVGEIQEWTDPEGLHLSCTTCFSSPLTHGAMVGAVEPDRARLWLRTHATRSAAIRVGSSADLSGPPVAWLYPKASQDYATNALIVGLEPDTTYFYDIEVAGERSKANSFRTAPALDAPTSFRFAFGSCTKGGNQPIFTKIDAMEPDLFLFVGDNHYANSNDLSSLRWFYRRARGLPERAAMLARTSTIAVWDDHDFVGNNTLGSAPGKEVALRTFVEYWANPSAGTEQTPGVFFRYRYGDVDFFMLDDRYYRGLDGTLLGQAQTKWLEQQLTASTATFKLLVSGSQFTSYGSSDSWAAYQSAQTALFDFIRDQKINGVVLLSGDVHRSELRIIERNSEGGYDLPELTSSPMANSNSSCKSSPELLACHDKGHYFVSVDIDTTLADPSLTAHIINAAGKTLASLPVLLSELSM